MPDPNPTLPLLDPTPGGDQPEETAPAPLGDSALNAVTAPLAAAPDATGPDAAHHEMPTLPLPDDPMQSGMSMATLPGSGGFDPNPDFAPPPDPVAAGYTVPHVQPLQHTWVHVPGETADYAAPPPPRPQPSAPYPAPVAHGHTAVHPYAQPGSSYPAPPGGPQPGYTQPTVPAGYRPNAPGPAGYGQPGYGPAGYPQQPYATHGGPLPPRPKRRRVLGCTPGCLMAFLGIFVTFCGGLTLLTIIATATLGAELENRLSTQIDRVEDYENFASTFFYDRNGTLLYEAFGEGRRVNIAYSEFPQALIEATIATEDDSFWTNPGFDPASTARAFLQFVGLAEGTSGGSTITQQLVRNVLFEPEYRSERSVQRKAEEILLAFLLNQRFSKEEILRLYLNEIYYGNLAYGAEAAATTFFNKSARDLTLAEAALIAGLPQAPAFLDPLSDDPEILAGVEQRWRTVLDRMVVAGYITDEARNQALREGYSIVPPEAPLRAPHFTVYAQRQLETLMVDLGYTPEQLARGGFRVYTTVDLRVHELAQNAARSQIATLAGNNVTNAAVLVTQPVTGEILAMVGSVDYDSDAIDGRVNVTVSPRQPGSTVKPFTYAAAMELGMSPADIIWDTETEIGGYRPVNYDRTFHGPVRLRAALANSYNIPAVQTLRRVGVENFLAFAPRFGINSLGTDASRYGLSLTLGGGEMTLLELVRGYSVFANGGTYVPTVAIRCIVTSDERIVFNYENGCPRGQADERTVTRQGYGQQVIDARIAYVISDFLGDNAARSPAMGSNSPLNTGALDASVKTGTTDDFRDNWTVGYTRNVAVGVWVGNSDGQPMVNSTGLTGAAPIWNSVINGVHNNPDLLAAFAVGGQLLPNQLDTPPGLTLGAVCAIDALRDPALDCARAVNEWLFDTPAAVPDGAGGMMFPQPTPPPQPPASGPFVQPVAPSIFRVLVHPIPADIAAGIQFVVDPGQPSPPPPQYCQVPVELAATDPSAREQLFIAPPPDPADAARAEQYARGAGLAFLPTIACSPELIGAVGGASIVTAFISSPGSGAVVSGETPIIGTASFAPGQVAFYKVELIGGPFGDWATIGSTHNTPVVNGVLEMLAPLQPGQYALQLVVVGNDGNYVQPPYRVDFVVP
jgi:penicillin-binding protein 1C